MNRQVRHRAFGRRSALARERNAGNRERERDRGADNDRFHVGITNGVTRQFLLFDAQPRLTMPASPLSVPQASRRPSPLQASAVAGASPGFLAKISAPSSMRAKSTRPLL